MKKGFTLVELLAVIVILAVILTIAVPAVKKTVDSAKKKTAENDALMIKGIAEKYYTANLESDEELTGIDLTSNTLSYSGEKPSKGYLYFTEDGIAYGKMYLNGYCIEITSSGETTSTKVSESECDVTGGKIKLATPLVSYDATIYNFIINKVDNVERYDIYNGNTKIASIDSNGDAVGTSTITTVDTGTSFIIVLASSDGKTRLNTAIPDECNLKVKAIAPSNSKTYIDSDFSESIQVDTPEESDTTAPSLTVTGESTSLNYYEITVTTSDASGIKEIRYYIDDTLVYSGTNLTYTGSTTKSQVTYKVESEDKKGNIATKTGTIYVTQCFVAGTKVLTKDGLKNIEDIKIGEYVYAINLDTNEKELSKVTDTIRTQNNKIYEVTLENGEVIKSTEKHEYYVLDKGWTRAYNLKVGDTLSSTIKGKLKIKNIVIKNYDKPVNTYNLTVEGKHNYLITEYEVLVHNIPSPSV